MKFAASLNEELPNQVLSPYGCVCNAAAQVLDAGGQVVDDGQEEV